jgi:hypothetical protein
MRLVEHILKIVWNIFGIKFRTVVGLLHQITTTQTKNKQHETINCLRNNLIHSYASEYNCNLNFYGSERR